MSTVHHITFPVLSTERTLLRQLNYCDAASIFKLRSDEIVNQFLDRPKTQSLEEATNFIEKINAGIMNHEWFYWAISLRNDPSLLIGTICLWNFSGDRSVAEIGYELDPGYQGKGFMQEAADAILGLAFTKIKLATIKAYTHINNNHSSKLLRKFGFKIKSNIEASGGTCAEFKNMVIYVLNANESGIKK
ncbi:MAG: GNAT family N-acetyltransferase [Ferruginibacter sp.]